MTPLRVGDLAGLDLPCSHHDTLAEVGVHVPARRHGFCHRVGPRHHFVVLIQCVGHRPSATARDRAGSRSIDAENSRIARRIRGLLNNQMTPLRVGDLAGLDLPCSHHDTLAEVGVHVPARRHGFCHRVGPRHHFVVLIQRVGHRPSTAARDRAGSSGIDAENGRIARRFGRLLNDQMAALGVGDLAGLDLPCSHHHTLAGVGVHVPARRHGLCHRVGPWHHFVVLIQCVGHRPSATARDRASPSGVDVENGRIARRIGRLLNNQMAPLRVRDLAGLDLPCSHQNTLAQVAVHVPARRHGLCYRIGSRRQFVVLIQCVGHRCSAAASDRAASGGVDAERCWIARRVGRLLNNQMTTLRVGDLAGHSRPCSHHDALAEVGVHVPARRHGLRHRVGSRRHFVVLIQRIGH